VPYNTNVSSLKPVTFTIGYAGKTLGEFLTALEEAGASHRSPRGR
jgi:hypothetical protein